MTPTRISLMLFCAALSLGALATSAYAEPTLRTAEIGCEVAEDADALAQIADLTTQWEQITSAYVRGERFDYESLRANADHTALLDRIVAQIGEASLEGRSDDERLAFLINAYNALVVKDVLTLWPVESVLAEEGFFDGRTHTVAGQTMTLNQLENDHIRGFGEPRIHFVVNCASVSCPPLLSQALTPGNLEASMASAATAYVRAQTTHDGASTTTSQIFEWFAQDFEAGGGVKAFLRAHLEGAPETVTAGALTYAPYDWALNAAP